MGKNNQREANKVDRVKSIITPTDEKRIIRTYQEVSSGRKTFAEFFEYTFSIPFTFGIYSTIQIKTDNHRQLFSTSDLQIRGGPKNLQFSGLQQRRVEENKSDDHQSKYFKPDNTTKARTNIADETGNSDNDLDDSRIMDFFTAEELTNDDNSMKTTPQSMNGEIEIRHPLSLPDRNENDSGIIGDSEGNEISNKKSSKKTQQEGCGIPDKIISETDDVTPVRRVCDDIRQVRRYRKQILMERPFFE
ncbi:uncharacterized protein LOC107041869 isoform X2 [Diachasma alloeum]|uniref:uncharacterized protein LOC107041869 isoform X2 n=1 Tax=Diachasma alloeum TaxID=454923 RepID=UPI00073842E5|nr:uncharacterized protein LOC107041869 isoform X2 [Diachasma alloeum]